MADSSQQFARLVESLVRQSRGRLSTGVIVALLVVLGVYLVCEPTLEKRWNVDLPGMSTPGQRPPVFQDRPPQTRPTPPPTQTADEADADASELESLLRKVGRDVFESPAGLCYTPGSQHGHRLKHLMAHTHDEPDRPGSHGVFDSTDAAAVVRLVDEAYDLARAGKQTRAEEEQDRIVYTVDLRRRIGYVGGESGQRQGHPQARYLRLVVQVDDDSARFITAFPVRNW